MDGRRARAHDRLAPAPESEHARAGATLAGGARRVSAGGARAGCRARGRPRAPRLQARQRDAERGRARARDGLRARARRRRSGRAAAQRRHGDRHAHADRRDLGHPGLYVARAVWRRDRRCAQRSVQLLRGPPRGALWPAALRRADARRADRQAARGRRGAAARPHERAGLDPCRARARAGQRSHAALRVDGRASACARQRSDRTPPSDRAAPRDRVRARDRCRARGRCATRSRSATR